MICSSKVSVLEGKSEALLQNFTQLEEKFNNLAGLLEGKSEALLQNINQLEDKFNKLPGLHSRLPAVSCAAIHRSSPSGHYWIMASNGSAVRVYCDMTRLCGNITGGWMRVASLDMRDNSSQCPSGLRLGKSCNHERTCEIGTDSPTGNCSSNSSSSHIFHYSHVCGMIRAYQFRTPDAFGYRRQTPLDIDSTYIDGVSLTHGVPHSRKHIWIFAADLSFRGKSYHNIGK